MKIDWKFVFKKSFSIVLKGLLVISGIYLLSVAVLSLVYRPMGVKVTNVTSSSATVSWYTNVPMTGVVSYKEKDGFLPLFLSGIGADKAYDDRDFAYAQKLCVAEFNMKLEKEVDEDFTVSGEDYNCDNVKVSKLGRYYVHHVTIKNLDEKKDYYFRVGNRVWGWKGDVVSFKTFETPENVKEPVPVFGRIVSSEGNYSGDSIVYGRFKDVSTGNESVMYSSVTNDDGGWYLDGGNLRGVDGEIVELSSGDDTFSVTGMYKNSKMSAPTTWVFGYFDGAYPDLKVAYSEKDNFLYKLVFGVNACNVATLVGCDADEIKELAPTVGYGNAAKALAAKNDNVLDKDVLKELGLCDNSVACAGNMSAIMGAGNGITENAWNATNGAGYAVELKKNDPDNEEERGYWDTNTIAPAGSGNNSGSSGGNNSSGGANNAPGDITITTNNSGNWELDFNGHKIASQDKVEEFLELTPSQQLTIQKCLEKSVNANCSIKIEPVQVNILKLYNAVSETNSGIKACLDEGSCNIPGLDKAIEVQIEALNKASTNYSSAQAALKALRDSIPDSPENPLLPEGGIVEPKYEFTGAPAYSGESDKIPNAWLDLFNKSATEEEKMLLALQLGATPEQIENYGINNIEFSYQSGTYVVSDTSDFPVVKLSVKGELPSVMISESTYKKIELENGSVTNSNLKPGYTTNTDPKTVYVIDEDFIASANKNLTEEERIKFAEEVLGLDISSEVRPNTFKLTLVNGKVVAEYQEDGSYQPKVDKATPPATINVDDKWIEEKFGGDVTTSSGVIVINKGDNKAYDFVEPIVASGSQACFSTSCTLEQAKKLISQDVADDTIIACESENKCYLRRIPTEEDIANQSSSIKEEIKELKIIQDSLQGPDSFLRKLIVRTTFAAEDNASNEGTLFFLPEYGMFSLQLGEFEFEKEISDGLTFYVFYLEVNGKEGFQMPVDPDNPTIHEDIVIKSRSFEINYEKKAEVKRYDVQAGINIISFDFVPVPTEGGAYTVSELVENARKNGTNIEYVSYFDGGRWVEGYKCTAESCIGSNFAILPGKGYVLKTSKKGSFTVSAYNLKSAIPLNLSAGWNLIGVHGYSSAYTAKSLINSINKVEGLTADNVSWYPTSKGRYEGLQVTEGVEYGFDFPINPMNGYFVRIKKFTPKDDACKSIIWHDGNDLNGTCGDSKSIF